MSSLLDLKSQLSFYGAYHSDLRNILVHVAFVPVIEWASLGLGILGSNSLGFGKELFKILGYSFGLDLGLLYAAGTSLFYVALDPVAGLLQSFIVLGLYATVKKFTLSGYPHVLAVLLALELVGWISQIVSHRFWEGRSPALLDNLVQALVLAPYFVSYEVLFYFGYRPKLRKEVDGQIRRLRLEWENNRKKVYN